MGSQHVLGFSSQLNNTIVRLEYLLVFLAALFMTIVQWREINWYAYIALFLYIDLFGYIPGLISTYRANGARIHRAYYLLYNTFHTFLTAIPIAVAVAMMTGNVWCILGSVIHLAGDRGLLNNWMKRPSEVFEVIAPKAHHEEGRLAVG